MLALWPLAVAVLRTFATGNAVPVRQDRPSPAHRRRVFGALSLSIFAYSVGNSVFSSAVVRASRLKPWKTNPIFSIANQRQSFLVVFGNIDAFE